MLGQTSVSCVTDGIRRGNRGDRGSECLGLASGPRLSLERLVDRLVRALASSTGVDNGSSVNNRCSVYSRMNNWSSVYSSVDNRSSAENRSRVDNRGSVDNRSSGNNGSSANFRGFRILSLTFVGDLSDKSVDGVGAPC